MATESAPPCVVSSTDHLRSAHGEEKRPRLDEEGERQEKMLTRDDDTVVLFSSLIARCCLRYSPMGSQRTWGDRARSEVVEDRAEGEERVMRRLWSQHRARCDTASDSVSHAVSISHLRLTSPAQHTVSLPSVYCHIPLLLSPAAEGKGATIIDCPAFRRPLCLSWAEDGGSEEGRAERAGGCRAAIA
jgi:hypothetical protein